MQMHASVSSATRELRIGPLVLAVPAIAFLVVFFAIPVFGLLALSVQSPDGGALTARYYAQIMATDVYVRVLLITFKIAGLTAALSLLLGYPVAYWLSKMPSKLQGHLVLFILLPFWTSYLVKTFAWMIVLGQTGVINRLLGLAGASPLPLLHNEFGVMVGMVHAMVPLAVLTMLPVMSSVDGRLEIAARTLGAPPARSFWLVYFPQTMPGLAAAGLLTFISSLGFFIVPSLLGGRQQAMLAQLIIAQVQELGNWAFAGALSTMLLLAAFLSCWLFDHVFGLTSLSGQASSGAGTPSKLRRAGLRLLDGLASTSDWLARIVCTVPGFSGRRVLTAYSAAVLVFLIVPILLVVPIAFTSSQFLDFPPPGYSLRWFYVYWNSDVWIGATLRSFRVGLLSALLACGLATFAALALARSESRWKGLIFSFFLAPMIVPRIIVAIGLFYLFSKIGLVATDTALILGHTVLALPYSVIVLGAVLKNHDWRLEQAAATMGANRMRVFVHVTLPRIRGGLVAAFLFAFITSFDELTIAMFNSGGISTTLPKQMWDDMVMQLNPTLAAASVVVTVVVSSMLLVAEGLKKKS
jgi:putative spermidine/putrescine transport system permease protein